MPSLADPKRENFAQMCARGLPTIEAYVRAGYKRNTGNATALKKRPDVAARIEEIQYEIAHNNQSGLNEFLKDTGLTPAFIVRKLLETGNEARDAGKFEVAAKCFKDLGGELFGMFLERKHHAEEKANSVSTQTNTTINIENLNQALEALGGPDQKVPKIVGDAEYVDLTGTLLPAPTIPSKQRRG